MKKAIALALSLVLALGTLAGCGGGKSKEPAYNGPSYDQLKVGEDYTDLKAELQVITSYQDDMTARLSSSNWGDGPAR